MISLLFKGFFTRGLLFFGTVFILNSVYCQAIMWSMKIIAFWDVQTKGHRFGYACVRLRCDFLKIPNRQMPHFTLFRTIVICRFMNFENQSPRTKTRLSKPMAHVPEPAIKSHYLFKRRGIYFHASRAQLRHAHKKTAQCGFYCIEPSIVSIIIYRRSSQYIPE